MLSQHRRRWTNINPAFVQSVMFAGWTRRQREMLIKMHMVSQAEPVINNDTRGDSVIRSSHREGLVGNLPINSKQPMLFHCRDSVMDSGPHGVMSRVCWVAMRDSCL